MPTYRIDDMTCGHCARAITQAVRSADPPADVHIDLARHLVRVDSTRIDDATIVAAIEQAGYRPVNVRPAVERETPAGTGCGCAPAGGCCGMRDVTASS